MTQQPQYQHQQQQSSHDIEGVATPQSASSTPVLYHQEADDDDDHPDGDDETPFLSVLNTVVDQIMMDPTPLLEPKEFEQQIPVPVLRVFGPIVRDASVPDGEPKQSACLYIHGAYPYLLARPVLAGPDGSSTSTSSGGHIDWDSVASVERILPQLQIALEGMIVASLESNNNFGGNAKKGASPWLSDVVSIPIVQDQQLPFCASSITTPSCDGR
jgi:hypothetical protein